MRDYMAVMFAVRVVVLPQMTDPTTVLYMWRKQADERRQFLLEYLARGLGEREYMQTCGALKELEIQRGHMQNLITGKAKEVENAED